MSREGGKGEGRREGGKEGKREIDHRRDDVRLARKK